MYGFELEKARSQLISGASACPLALAVFPARPGLLGVLAIVVLVSGD